MSDKPQEDILDQIITQGLNKMDTPPEPPQEEASRQNPPQGETAPEEAPAGQDGKTASPAQKRNKRSSVYIYLLILFGAAFMMLLLAYFVQQRSNASTIDELRSSMNLSREKLLEQIETLEKDKESLRKEISRNNDRANQAQTQYNEAVGEVETLQELFQQKAGQLTATVMLGYLERFCGEKDWLMAAILVEKSDPLFNEHNKLFCNEESPYTTPVQRARYLELRERVFDNAGCMVMEQFFSAEDQSEYTELPYIHSAGLYDDETVNTARTLLGIFQHAALNDYYDISAYYMMTLYLDGVGLDWLEDSAFQPSTVDLVEQIMGNLSDKGALETHEDGTVSFLIGNDQFITFKIDSAEIVQCDVPREGLPGWISDIVYGDNSVSLGTATLDQGDRHE